ncbi:MAG: hypothetical protein SPJ83_09305 [Helicobacter sp.]|nr:hypothetical protein [Helicobacter sp.]MDY5822961.1 hypothetical protein [Helicobacter sp.]
MLFYHLAINLNNFKSLLESSFYKVCTLTPCTHPFGLESRFQTIGLSF